MKQILFFLFLFAPLCSLTQREFNCVIFVNEENKDISQEVKIEITGHQNPVNWKDFCQLLAENTLNLTCKIYHKNQFYQSFSVKQLQTEDTVFINWRKQNFEEIVISSSAFKKESEDSMHVVDFHFVKGKLFTIEKNINSLHKKYVKIDKKYFEVPKRTKLNYIDIDDNISFFLGDSIFRFSEGKLHPFLSKDKWKAYFSGYLGKNQRSFYYNNNFFYRLIDEYVIYDKAQQKETPIYFTYDSTTFYLISQQYRKFIQSGGDPPTFLIYNKKSKRYGEKFLNIEDIKVSAPDIKTGQLFKLLRGSPGFVKMVTSYGLHSRCEAYNTQDTLYIFDFNRNELNVFKEREKIKSFPIEKGDFLYKNEFKIDVVTQKAYFLVQKHLERKFLEINLKTGVCKLIDTPKFLSSYHHWEMNNGRVYLLLSNSPSSDWKRVFYSIKVGRKGINGF